MITQTFRKGGFQYRLFKQGQKSLIYERCNYQLVKGYEVHRLRMQKERYWNGRILRESNRLPIDEDFGKWAWSFITLRRALFKFDELERIFGKAVAPELIPQLQV